MEKNKRRNRAQWSEIIAAQETSGLSGRAFCAKRGIGLWGFYDWRRRLREEPERKRQRVSPAFIEVAPETVSDAIPANESSWQIVLELGGGMSLTLRRG
jgi:hypothetical protein